MLLNSTRRHSKSLSCTLLQREMQKQNNEVLTCRRTSNPEFVPFCLERKLGKLIIKEQKQQERKPSNAELLEKINFRNFHKIYTLVSKHENERYSQLTRRPEQRNLINKEWKVHSLAMKPPRTFLRRSEMNASQQRIEERQKFSKMNEHLFKKLSKVKQPADHPELKDMYENYIKICEINENIRREQLLKGSKH